MRALVAALLALASLRRVASKTAPVDVVLLADPQYAVGVAAIINAARFHTKAPVRFWVGFDGDPALLHTYLACVGVDNTSVTVRRPLNIFESSSLASLSLSRDKWRLKSSANFARFTIPDLFPEIGVAWYLDVDALPLSNLAAPVAEFEASAAVVRPVIRPGTIAKAFSGDVAKMYQAKYRRRLVLSAPSWNAGVWLADFAQWRERDIAAEALYWTEKKETHRGDKPLWKLATQPLMYLLFNADLASPKAFLPRGWNCEAYQAKASKTPIGTQAPTGCKVLHWNGEAKPWDRDTAGHGLWAKYMSPEAALACRALLPAPPPPPPEDSSEGAEGRRRRRKKARPESCANRVLDGDETDVDCGGTVCPPCATGRLCWADSDCDDEEGGRVTTDESTVVCAAVGAPKKKKQRCVDFRVSEAPPADDPGQLPGAAFLGVRVALAGLPLPLFSGAAAAAVRRAVSETLSQADLLLAPTDVLVVAAVAAAARGKSWLAGGSDVGTEPESTLVTLWLVPPAGAAGVTPLGADAGCSEGDAIGCAARAVSATAGALSTAMQREVLAAVAANEAGVGAITISIDVLGAADPAVIDLAVPVPFAAAASEQQRSAPATAPSAAPRALAQLPLLQAPGTLSGLLWGGEDGEGAGSTLPPAPLLVPHTRPLLVPAAGGGAPVLLAASSPAPSSLLHAVVQDAGTPSSAGAAAIAAAPAAAEVSEAGAGAGQAVAAVIGTASSRPLPPLPPLPQRVTLPENAAAAGVGGVTDVVLLADASSAPGVAAVISAALAHTSGAVRFWVGLEGLAPARLYAYLACIGVDSSAVAIRTEDEEAAGKQRQQPSTGVAPDPAVRMTRFAIPDLFPELSVAWYLDTDVLPVGDLAEPIPAFVASGAAIRPVGRAAAASTLADVFDPAIAHAYAVKHNRSSSGGGRFDFGAPVWEPGVWLADFEQWSQRRVAAEAAQWIDIKAAFPFPRPLWQGVSPEAALMFLLFHEDTRSGREGGLLPSAWNCEVGSLAQQDFGDAPPPGCALVHWSGLRRPWDPAAVGHGLWKRYVPRFGDARCTALLAEAAPGAVMTSPPPPPPPPLPTASSPSASEGGTVHAAPPTPSAPSILPAVTRPAPPSAASPPPTGGRGLSLLRGGQEQLLQAAAAKFFPPRPSSTPQLPVPPAPSRAAQPPAPPVRSSARRSSGSPSPLQQLPSPAAVPQPQPPAVFDLPSSSGAASGGVLAVLAGLMAAAYYARGRCCFCCGRRLLHGRRGRASAGAAALTAERR